jgi:Na+-transporting methylmalonyl-CoA/oxaloacetate decarboxylase gamma subunit
LKEIFVVLILIIIFFRSTGTVRNSCASIVQQEELAEEAHKPQAEFAESTGRKRIANAPCGK